MTANPCWTRIVFALVDAAGHVIEEEDSLFTDAEFTANVVPDVGEPVRIEYETANETRWVVRRRWGFAHADDGTDVTVVCLYMGRRSPVSALRPPTDRPPH